MNSNITNTSKTYKITQNGEVVMSITITPPKGVTYTNIEWDSRTGLVTANVDGSEQRKPINYTGQSYGTLQPEPFEAENIYHMSYNYWYY